MKIVCILLKLLHENLCKIFQNTCMLCHIHNTGIAHWCPPTKWCLSNQGKVEHRHWWRMEVLSSSRPIRQGVRDIWVGPSFSGVTFPVEQWSMASCCGAVNKPETDSIWVRGGCRLNQCQIWPRLSCNAGQLVMVRGCQEAISHHLSSLRCTFRLRLVTCWKGLISVMLFSDYFTVRVIQEGGVWVCGCVRVTTCQTKTRRTLVSRTKGQKWA